MINFKKSVSLIGLTVLSITTLKSMPFKGKSGFEFQLTSRDEMPTMRQAMGDIRVLDLSNQAYVDDNFIRDEILRKSTRLISIDLRGTSVTQKSLDEIGESGIVGTVRDLPQVSSRYERPSAEVEVKLNKGQIPNVEDRFRKAFGPFTLQYKHPATGQPNFPEDRDAIKTLNIKRE